MLLTTLFIFTMHYSPLANADQDVIVAVIDTGLDLQHTDIKKYIWTNSKEIPGNKIDDDKNGFIDDVNGWNFANQTPQISDTHGHGTHVSGLIIKNFGKPNGLKIMTLKYYQEGQTGLGHLTSTINAIKYAVQMGAQIINYSGGGSKPHADELSAIKEAMNKKVLFVAAAGNEGNYLSDNPFYPAGYGLSNILAVAAVDTNNKFFKHSNFDKKIVHIAAPGESVISTLPNNRFGALSGTSQATAIVSGVAALVLKDSNFLYTPEEVTNRLMATGKFNSALANKTQVQTQIDTLRAVVMKTERTNAAGLMIAQPEYTDFL